MEEITLLTDNRFKDYPAGKLHTMGAQNFTEYQKYFYDFTQKSKDRIESRKRFDVNSEVLRDNRKRMASIFGKHFFTFKGEFLYKCWAAQFKGYQFIILTAAGKGTCVEIVGFDIRYDKDNKDAGKATVEFFLKLSTLLSQNVKTI